MAVLLKCGTKDDTGASGGFIGTEGNNETLNALAATKIRVTIIYPLDIWVSAGTAGINKGRPGHTRVSCNAT